MRGGTVGSVALERFGSPYINLTSARLRNVFHP